MSITLAFRHFTVNTAKSTTANTSDDQPAPRFFPLEHVNNNDNPNSVAAFTQP